MATRIEHTKINIDRTSLTNIVADYEAVQQGLAQQFRKTINDNFTETKDVINEITNDIKTADETVNDTINEMIDEVWDAMVNVKLSKTQPTGQQLGDFWFNDLS